MIPIQPIKVSEIARELGVVAKPFDFSDLFNVNLINPNGLNSNYCAGGDAQARLTNITTKPYQIGKFRGYRHGMVYLFASPNKLYQYNPDTNVAQFVDNYYSGSTDIAMSTDRVWFLYSQNPVNIYEYSFDLRYPETLNFLRSLSSGLNQSAGLCSISNSVLVMGGEGSIKVLNITTSPATVMYSIPINGMVSGDIIYLAASNVILVTVLGSDSVTYIRKYNFTTGALLSWVSINPHFAYGLFTWRNKAYMVTTAAKLYEINVATLTITLITTITGLGGVVQGACNTPFNNINL